MNSLEIAANGELEIVMTRAFNAPRDLVFRAWTEPELLQRWLGVWGGWALAVCEVDLRVGGTYRYVWHKQSNGAQMAFRGVYHEISRPGRLVYTEGFDDAAAVHERSITVRFEEQDGRTAVTCTLLHDSRDARDAALRSPMERGVAASYNALDEVLPSLQEKVTV